MRKYTGVLQFFHNHEHSPDGLNHCHSDGQYAYRIRHEDGKHIISSQVVCGHGLGNKPQWFRFTKRLGDGYDMTSAVRIDAPGSQLPAQVPRVIERRNTRIKRAKPRRKKKPTYGVNNMQMLK